MTEREFADHSVWFELEPVSSACGTDKLNYLTRAQPPPAPRPTEIDVFINVHPIHQHDLLIIHSSPSGDGARGVMIYWFFPFEVSYSRLSPDHAKQHLH